MKSSSLRVVLGVCAALLAIAVGWLLLVPGAADRPRWPDGSATVVIGTLALALGVVLVVLYGLQRRLRRMTAALDASGRGDGPRPLRLGGAPVGGDELDRLADRIEQLAERVAGQQAALDQATRQRSELLANVSHDLRTPLASMQGYLELLLLRDDLSGAEARNYLQTAARQSERLGRLVADLFELTRLEAEGTRPDLEEFAIAELSHDVVQKFAADAERRGVRLACVDAGAPAPPLRVRADIGLAERVLAGLVENALRHTPSGGAVTLAAAMAEGRAVLTVADTGEGIAAVDLPGLFDRYYRAERVGGANRVSGHGGLGLAIARRIVNLHGGELAVESRAGTGTQITFDLPLAEPLGLPAPACPARDAVA